MTREELIERICPTDNVSECGSVECNFCCDDCNNMLECMLLEYEKQIYNKALDDFAEKILNWKPQDEEYRSFKDVVDEIKEQLIK